MSPRRIEPPQTPRRFQNATPLDKHGLLETPVAVQARLHTAVLTAAEGIAAQRGMSTAETQDVLAMLTVRPEHLVGVA